MTKEEKILSKHSLKVGDTIKFKNIISDIPQVYVICKIENKIYFKNEKYDETIKTLNENPFWKEMIVNEPKKYYDFEFLKKEIEEGNIIKMEVDL